MLERMLHGLRKVKPKYLGLRTIKTTIAVMVSALVMRYVFHDTAFFACVGAVVAMEKTIRDSYHAAIIRNLGTLVGGVVGIIFAQLTSNTLLFSFGVIPIILIKNAMNKQQSIVPGCIVYFAVVYLNTYDTALFYGVRRILETFLGTVIAIVINYLIFPPKKRETMDDNLFVDREL